MGIATFVSIMIIVILLISLVFISLIALTMWRDQAVKHESSEDDDDFDEMLEHFAKQRNPSSYEDE